MVVIYHDDEGDLSVLKGKTLAMIGYGNQGRAQALNLRDSGTNVIIGNREDEYRQIAQEDNFDTYPIEEAIKKCDIAFLLLPDEIMADVFEEKIKPHLKEGTTINFASGYNVGFDLIDLPEPINVIMIAPRMIGVGVRENFLTGEGFFSFVGIEQDYTGNATDILLALAKGIGTLKKGAIKMSFKDEAVLDLFNEQGFGPAFGRVLLSAIYTLIEAGYPPEAVLIEMYMSKEMAYTYKKMADVGLVKQTDFHSQTSQYGAMSRGIRYRKLPVKTIMERTLKEIENGDFTEEWEKKISKLKFKIIKFFATKQKINKLEKQVRNNLGLKLFDIYEEEPPTIEEVEQAKEIAEELKKFEQYYE